jgi:protein-disulfide isomerase
MATGSSCFSAPINTPASGAATNAGAPRDATLAIIGHQHITEADVIAQDQSAFSKLDSDYTLKLHQLQLKQAQERHELLEQQLNKLLDERALDLEASARGSPPATVLTDIKVSVVTDDEIRAFYEQRKGRTNQSLDQLRPEITRYLANQHNADAMRAFYDGLRSKYHIESMLAPYRVNVAATGPARGKSDAAVTIVEFADFQCPYCREAEATLRDIMSRHADDVRIVFRNLPLPTLHPNATIAAEAAVCADRQGMFWVMHDAMFNDQTALTAPALRDTAARLGLDAEGFAACLADSHTKELVDDDAATADGLNITGTPYFFINGRPLNGSVPIAKFESIIDEELKRNASKRG